MKNSIHKTESELITVNEMKYIINCKDSEGNNMTIKIRLSDPCKNGHNDFSITGDIYEKNQPKIDKYYLSGGCIHEDILKVQPELKQFVDLHLSDVNGTPMYAIENGFYHLSGVDGVNVCKNYIRATDKEMELIKTAENSAIFSYYLTKLGIVNRWKIEANQAIKQLEVWCNVKFKDNSTRFQSVILDNKKMKAIEDQINSGYYSTKKIEERNQKKVESTKKNQIKAIKAELKKDIESLKNEANVKLAILDINFSIDNFIYYKNSNVGCFNWKNYGPQLSEDQFMEFSQKIDYSKLPKGIKFKLGK